MRAGVVQRHVGVGHALAVVGGFSGRHLQLRGEQGDIAVDHKLGGGLVGLRHVLRHLGDPPLGGHVEVALVFVQGVIEQAEQAGLAGAVAADQAHFFAGVDGGGGAIEQDLRTATKDQVFQCDHGRGVG